MVSYKNLSQVRHIVSNIYLLFFEDSFFFSFGARGLVDLILFLYSLPQNYFLNPKLVDDCNWDAFVLEEIKRYNSVVSACH